MRQLLHARTRRASRIGSGSDIARRDIHEAVSGWFEALEVRRLFAAVLTDKSDYAFGEVAQITGSEFQAGETVQLQVTHADGTEGSNDDPQNQAWQVQADAEGNIAATWLVNDPDAVGATYILTATGLTSGEVATATFTDSRTITSVTLNGVTSVTVAPGASITAVVNVTTDNGGGNSNWRATRWQIATTTPSAPGGLVLVDHVNHDGIGVYNESFTITAPTTPGTYNAYFIAYSNDAGTTQASATFVLTASIVVNGPPAITLPGGPLSYTENAAPAIIDAGATVSDDSVNFDTGTLTVDYAAASGTADDRLAIRNQGTGAGQIGVSGSNVTFGGTTIGTFTGGTGTTPLVITFNASATPAAAQALMRNITFANVSDNPSTAARTVRFVLTDGDPAGTSNAATKTINVTAVNDAPAVAANNASVTVNEGQTASNTGTYSDVDSANVAISASVGTVTKTGTNNGTWSWSLGTTDGPNQSQTVTITANDGNGGITTTTFSLTVNNVSPTIAISGAANVNEGSSYSLTLGAVTDPGADTVTSYVVHWGDGSSDTYSSNGIKTHTYADGPNTYDITVDLVDEDGTYLDTANDLSVTVNNVAPQLAAPADQAADEGESKSFNLGSFTDPAGVSDQPYVVSVDWGDGSPDTTFNVSTPGSLGSKSHTYADDGAYTVTITVTEDGGSGANGVATFSANIANVAPTISISGATNVNEGSSYSLTLGAVTDPGNDTVASYVVHWGDGSSDTYTSNGVKTHTYADGPTSHDITVDLVDEDGTFTDAANDLGVTVDNVAPTIAISGAANVNEGASYSLTLGAVTDPGSDTVTSYVVHWGDGSSSTYSINGVKTHTYADGPNSYDITVDLVDEDGTYLDAANALNVTVNNVAPSIAISGASNVDEGSSYTLNLGAVTDPGNDTVASYVVHWGDGSSDTYTSNGNKTHTYTDGPNSYNITVDLADEDGTFLDRANALSVTVDNVEPSIVISGAADVNEGSSYTLTLGAVTDPGTDTVTSYIVHWGDGNSDTYTATGDVTHTYADGPNNYAITVDLVDEDGTHLDRANALSVAVKNVAPTIAITGAASVNEGSSYSLTLGAVTDPGDDTISNYVVHWGDGSSSTYTASGVVTHTYADGPDSYNITVDLEDEDGTYLDRANALSVTVNNVSPTIAISGASNVNEGAAYSLTLGAVTDPGNDTISSYVVHWGDGTSDTYGSNGVKTHTYADGPNSFNVTVDLVDEDGTYINAANALSVTVDNVRPTIAISGAANVDEGSSYSLTLGAVTDPGSDTITSYIVHWGDGNSDTYATASGAKSHVYADGSNSYNITVDLVDEDGTHLDRGNALSVTVNNVAPTIAISGNASVAEGSSYTLNLGAVTDPGSDIVTSYVVHWGDGSSSTYGSGGDVTHTYADGPNNYSITVDLVDEDGTHLDRANALSVAVNNVAPTIAISGSGSANEGSSYSLTLGAVTDPGADTISSYVVHWGDGSSDTYTSNGVKTHTYADGTSSYNVTVDIVDEDGTHLNAASAHSVTVNNVNPNATANAYTLNEDGSTSGNVITDNAGSGADSDPAGANDPLVVSAVNGSAAAVGMAIATDHGSVKVNADGTFTYTPAPNYFGSDSFTYTIADGDGGSSTATVSFTISEVNDPPDALNDTASTPQDSAFTGNVLANDGDTDNAEGIFGNEDTLAVTAHTGPAHGTLTIGPDGAFTYTPHLGYSGTDSFTYTISDGRGGTDTATVNIDVGAAAAFSVYLRDDDCFGGQMLIVNGSSAADDINISPTTDNGVQVKINGVLKGTYYPTGRIVVFGYAGADQITVAGSVPNPAWLYGDAGDDLLNLGNGGGIVWGGDGNDHINGGSGCDILIGGQGGDRIVGNPGDDILCAGLTKYDNRFGTAYDHEEAWCGLYHEWARKDLTTISVAGDSSYTSFEQRIDRLSGVKPGGLNGGYVLNNTTVDDDDSLDQIDMLTGSAGDDWFLWTKGEDKVNGMSAAEGLEDLDSIS